VKNFLFFIFLQILIVSNLVGQRREVKTLSAEKRHHVATSLIKQGGYYAAIDHMKDLIEKYPDNQEYMFKLADAYFHSRDYTNAEKWFEKLTETKDLMKKQKSKLLTIATFRYGESLKYNAKYDQAREVFDIFSNSTFKDIKGENYRAWAKNEVLSCEFALNNKDKVKFVEVLNLDSNINAAYSDFAPRLQNDSTLVYSSIQEDSVISVRHGDKHFEHTKIFTSTYRDSAWQEPVEKEKVNSIFEHSANGTYSADGKHFYFSRCRPINGKMKCQIYVSNVSSENKLSNPKIVGGGVNHGSYTSTQPYAIMMKSGKSEQEILFFASNKKGTNGGMDIWYSTIGKNGKVAKPINCGRTINSPRDEVTPYYDSENKVLYFSSNYHYGFGGFDVFKAVGSLNKYDKVENMSKPINSNLDDTYYTLTEADKYKGFLVSNRPGGMALLSATCCDDIYSFNNRQPTVLFINIVDSLTGEVIPNAKLTVKSTRYSPLPDSILFNTNGEVMDKMEQGKDPSVLDHLNLSEKPSSFYVLDPKNLVQLEAKVPGYKNVKTMLRTNEIGSVDSVHVLEGSLNKSVLVKYVTINMSMAKIPKSEIVRLIVKEKRDTTKLESTLKEEYEKAQKAKAEQLANNGKVSEPSSSSSSSNTTKAGKNIVFLSEFALNLQFQYDKSEIVAWHQSRLDSLVDILKSNPSLKMDFTTHTDAIGSEEYNMKLSYRRAQFISNYIVTKGVSQKRVNGIGMGEQVHIAPNAKPDGTDYPEGRQKNRRTDIKLITGL
jgi:outer membrane protein OmpA-like peptidoglycan-associated protein